MIRPWPALFTRLAGGWVLACTLLVLLSGCGLFTPLTADPPGSTRPRDRLGFAGILSDHPTEELAVNDYADMFSASFVYLDAAGSSWSRDRVIARIRTINERISSTDTLVVRWSRQGSQSELMNREKTVVLQPRTWTVTRTVKDSLPLVYAGTSTFELVYDGTMEAWRIASWTDRSDDPAHPLSYFLPDFQE